MISSRSYDSFESVPGEKGTYLAEKVSRFSKGALRTASLRMFVASPEQRTRFLRAIDLALRNAFPRVPAEMRVQPCTNEILGCWMVAIV
eukprot:5312754-Pyramimonas_sp.AAC.1